MHLKLRGAHYLATTGMLDFHFGLRPLLQDWLDAITLTSRTPWDLIHVRLFPLST